MAALGFLRRDFEVFAIDGFSARMAKIGELVTPRLVRLGKEIAPDLSQKLNLEFFPHIARHMRRIANPPDETWVAFGPSPAGYKRYGYLALCISGVGIHARAIVKPDADNRAGIRRLIKANAPGLEKSFRGTKIQQYNDWDYRELPRPIIASANFFAQLGDALERKSASIDVGFGWPPQEALKLDRAELLDAFRELAPLYRMFQIDRLNAKLGG